ncbi:hypothetical protein ACLN6N_13890 [Sphingomonas carotinifaciens]|uniref:Uncharacterized protein n=1 Tax=Sphingomonas carotinifaciens TaxID=1166323 RepID=A0A1G7FVG6_9SPHN|nr:MULTISPECIES: hypothetical protein [Sphingomonas]MBB4086248.1 hypothetical protein [Sphingomonas carotinifaciens]MWC42571.1 hypothetical protein [Sphingomonas carotinifaciens]SDE79745.1 hypothetical protein SAMN05216557_101566 [Sphingomonas carotinifaciens]
MIRPPIRLLAALATPALIGAADGPHVRVTQMTVRERIVVRVPRVGMAMRQPMAPAKWKERKGPKCIAASTLAGALVSETGSVDLVLTGGSRVRAKLSGECRQLDFYSGFYLRPAPDGRVCADRDAIRMRSGAACEIDRFRTLVPAK